MDGNQDYTYLEVNTGEGGGAQFGLLMMTWLEVHSATGIAVECNLLDSMCHVLSNKTDCSRTTISCNVDDVTEKSREKMC